MTPIERAELYRGIRSVLARHYIDLGRLRITVSPSCVRLHGEMYRLPGLSSALEADLVQSILREIERLPHLRRLVVDLDNWRRSDEDPDVVISTVSATPSLHPGPPNEVSGNESSVSGEAVS
jgi:hypothetical protein